MKQIFIIVLIFGFTASAAQTKNCDCSAPLDRNLKTTFISNEYREFKSWLYTYFQKDESTRIEMKKNDSKKWGGKLSAVIESLPVNVSGNTDLSTSKENQKYFKAKQLYEKNGYLTDAQFNQVIEEHFDINQLEAYKACLDLCKADIAEGVAYIASGDLSDEFYIQVNFNSKYGGEKITLKGDAIFNNIEPIGNLIFKDGLTIEDRQSVTQYFKRVDPNKKASFGLNLKERISRKPIELKAEPMVNKQPVPIGTIVASVLNYAQFLKVNGLDKLDNENMEIAIWVPCDGRTIGASKYAKYSSGKVPDLRGVFLRGINDYGVSFNSVVQVADTQKNPEQKSGGEFQSDEFRAHDHETTIFNDKIPRSGGHTVDIWRNEKKVRTSKEGGAETRPKNVTVYFYLKIND